MEVKLRVLEGKNAGQEVGIRGAKYFIGRADDCQLRPRSELVSRHHCVILIEDGFVAVRDFGSKNGTFVNDERVRGEQELNSGDRLTVGNLHFEVQVSAGPNGKQEPTTDSPDRNAVAAAATPDDDIDLDDWLEGGDTAASTETQTIDMFERTGSEKPKEPQNAPAKNRVQGEDEEVKVVGVSKKRAKSVTAASSRGAAEEALKNLLRGGGWK